MPTCSECTQEKPGEAFYVDRSRPRGRVARCKVCYSHRQAESRTNPRRRYSEAKSNAIRRGIAWRLSFDEFLDWFWDADCHYCGSPKSRGIDRMGNEPIYELSNTVPCCQRCNSMKSVLAHHEFLEHVKKIAGYLDLLGTPESALGPAIVLGGEI